MLKEVEELITGATSLRLLIVIDIDFVTVSVPSVNEKESEYEFLVS